MPPAMFIGLAGVGGVLLLLSLFLAIRGKNHGLQMLIMILSIVFILIGGIGALISSIAG